MTERGIYANEPSLDVSISIRPPHPFVFRRRRRGGRAAIRAPAIVGGWREATAEVHLGDRKGAELAQSRRRKARMPPRLRGKVEPAPEYGESILAPMFEIARFR